MKADRREFIKKSTAFTALSLSGMGVAGTTMAGCADPGETPFGRVEKKTPVKSDIKRAGI